MSEADPTGVSWTAKKTNELVLQVVGTVMCLLASVKQRNWHAMDIFRGKKETLGKDIIQT